jgi:hypothetical protein
MKGVWHRGAGVALAVALAACGARGSSTEASNGDPLITRLLSGDDVPAGYRPLPLASDVTRRWCGAGALAAPSARRHASEVLVSQPEDGTEAVLTDTVLEFAPGDGARFVDAMRHDQRSCNRPEAQLANGLSIEGDRFGIALPAGGDEQLVMDVRGTAHGPAVSASSLGALARIVVRRGDVVVVIEDAVAGVQLDTGFRDRLAVRAAEQAEAGV